MALSAGFFGPHSRVFDRRWVRCGKGRHTVNSGVLAKWRPGIFNLILSLCPVQVCLRLCWTRVFGWSLCSLKVNKITFSIEAASTEFGLPTELGVVVFTFLAPSTTKLFVLTIAAVSATARRVFELTFPAIDHTFSCKPMLAFPQHIVRADVFHVSVACRRRGYLISGVITSSSRAHSFSCLFKGCLLLDYVKRWSTGISARGWRFLRFCEDAEIVFL